MFPFSSSSTLARHGLFTPAAPRQLPAVRTTQQCNSHSLPRRGFLPMPVLLPVAPALGNATKQEHGNQEPEPALDEDTDQTDGADRIAQ